LGVALRDSWFFSLGDVAAGVRLKNISFDMDNSAARSFVYRLPHFCAINYKGISASMSVAFTHKPKNRVPASALSFSREPLQMPFSSDVPILNVMNSFFGRTMMR